MTRMVSPDSGCVQVDVPTVRDPKRYSGRIIDVESPTHARMLREAGYFDASVGGTPKTAGTRCEACGFAGFFTTCGRCGSQTVKA